MRRVPRPPSQPADARARQLGNFSYYRARGLAVRQFSFGAVRPHGCSGRNVGATSPLYATKDRTEGPPRGPASHRLGRVKAGKTGRPTLTQATSFSMTSGGSSSMLRSSNQAHRMAAEGELSWDRTRNHAPFDIPTSTTFHRPRVKKQPGTRIAAARETREPRPFPESAMVTRIQTARAARMSFRTGAGSRFKRGR
jgi:hypothetical protein